MADSGGLTDWPTELIPDHDRLYMRVHRNHQVNGTLSPGAFRDQPPGGERPGMSTDWSRYSTPESTLRRARKPEDNGVVEMLVGHVRAIPNLLVEHTPLPDNRAHTDVFGQKDVEVRVLLQRACRWVVPAP